MNKLAKEQVIVLGRNFNFRARNATNAIPSKEIAEFQVKTT